MDNPVVIMKLETVRRCLQRIEQKRPGSAEELANDLDAQDIIAVNLERAIQTCVDIAAILIAELGLKTGTTMAECFQILAVEGILPKELSVKMQKSVGFRNISVHQYQSIDWELVFDIITGHLGNFREYITAVMGVSL